MDATFAAVGFIRSVISSIGLCFWFLHSQLKMRAGNISSSLTVLLMLFGLSATAQATTVALSAPANAAVFATASNVVIAVTATPTTGQTITKVDFYQGTTLLGTSTTSPYSFTWNNVAAGSYSLTAKATTNTAAVSTSAARTITVAAPPAASLTAPANNAVLAAASTITLSATATVAAGQTITKVDFYQGTTLIASDTTAPYSISWAAVPAGSYSITAKVTTNLGLVTTSTPVAITVAAAPTISLTAPANATTVGAGSNVTISATAAATGQTITKVDFYQGTTLLGTVTAAPYNFVWNAVPVGSYSLTAKVTTNLGLNATSAARTITVAALPTVTLTSPVTSTISTPPATLTVSATAVAATGQTITKVDFYLGTTLIATDTTAPYSVSWTYSAALPAIPPGSYVFTAKVTSNLGLVTTSAPATVTVVAANTAPTITLTAPANATNVRAGSNVTLSATATAATGQTITKVDFYNGATLLGTSTVAPYSYIWNAVPTGNYGLTAKVTTSTGLNATSTASTLNVVAAPTISLTSPTNNATATAPASFVLNATAATASGATISKVDFYNGVTLLGTVTTAPYSYTWNNVVAGSYSLTAKVTDSLGSVTTSTSVAVIVTANTPPTITLTAPLNNAVFPVNANITLTANPVATGQTITKVDFYQGATLLGTTTAAPYSFLWSNVAAGGYSLTAKVTTSTGVTATSTASTLNVIAAPTISLTSPANNATATAPASFTLSATATAASGATVSKVDFYNGVTLLGTTTTTPYSYAWNNVASGNYTITAKATDSLGSVGTSTAASVTVNALPTISLTAPANSTTVGVGSNVTISATAAAIGQTITQVDFYQGATLLGTATTAPYSFLWSNVAVGSYSLTAKATTNLGLTATSISSIFSVIAAPTISLTSPTNNATAAAPANFTLSATAVAASGATITKVDFYNGATLLGTATAAPYSYTWSNVASGAYTLTAKATDSLGSVTTSAAANVTVNALPTISLTAPANPTTVGVGNNLTITATAAATGQTITQVDFYQGSTLLGTATTAPYSFIWNVVPAGSYSLTAKVTTNLGLTATSNASTLNVVAAPTISLTSPANNATAIALASFALNATVAAASGATITKVDFYNGVTLLGTATSTPYSYTWNNVAAGSYSLTAKATDSLGSVTTSVAANVTVNALPTITLTSPANPTTVGVGSNVTLSASAAATGQTITQVDFYQGTTLLGTATTAPYTYNWANVPTGSYSLTAKVTTNLGLTATSAASSLNVIAAPAISLTSPANNATATAPASFTLSATAAAASGASISKVDFYNGAMLIGTANTAPYTYTWSNVALGSYSITAKVTDSLSSVTTSTAANVTVNALPTISLTAPTNPTTVGVGSNVTIAATAAAIGQTITKVDFYQGATLLGTATTAPYNYIWSNVAVGSYILTAKVTTNLGLTATSAIITLNVAAAPTISLTSPANNTAATAPASFTLSATASAASGQTISKVDFYNGAALLGTATTAPYSYTWSNVASGTYTITARATDSLGSATTSTAAVVSVNAPPTVTLTSPVNTSSIAAPATITLSANAADSDGTIAKVDFYNGATLLGTATTAPYSYIWNNVAIGSYSLTAIATDNLSATTTSTIVTVTVVDNTPPTITHTTPLNNSNVTSATPTITAQYQDAESGVDAIKVGLLLDNVDVSATATITTTGLSYQSSNLAEGTHQVALKVYDKAGNLAQSAWQFTVDTLPPVISAQIPVNGSYALTTTPTVSASFQDGGVGIDTTRTLITLDGVDITAVATLTASNFAYTATTLTAGAHQVTLKVYDLAGNIAQSSWSFSIDTTPPVISAQLPINNSYVANAAPVITAQYLDAESGIEAAKVQLLLDGVDVSATATITASGISYQSVNLAEGAHQVSLKVYDQVGNLAQAVWQFTVDTILPVVSAQSPINTYLPGGAMPVISASYSDTGSGVDLAKVTLQFDGVNVTSQAVVSPTDIQYTVSQPLPDLTHQVNLVVVDKAGNVTTSNWQFVTATPPQITATTPSNVMLPPDSIPTISAGFLNSGSGINLASVHMLVNGVDVSSQASITAAGISYTPPQALASGPYTVYLSVDSNTNATATAVWSFEVDVQKIYNVAITSPVSGQTVTSPKMVVTATANANKTYPSNLTLNGIDMSASATAIDGTVTYSGNADLIDGSNTLSVTATFADGTTRSATTQANYDAPSTLAIVSPADRTTLGPVVGGTSPLNLTGNVERPVTITGHTSKPVQSVTINQQAATLDASGSEFSFPNFFLHEGTNLVTAVSTDSYGRISTASITVSVDQTAPFLAVEAPFNNSVTSGNTIDVRGTVNDAVEGYYSAAEPTVSVVSATSSTATQVADKQYLAAAVPLELGENILTVTATDQLGNARSKQIKIIRVASGSERLTMYAGNAQVATVGTALAKPLTIAAMDQDGRPLANRAITFDIARGTGLLFNTQSEQIANTTFARNLVITTDTNGLASVWLTLGKQSGPGSNAVHASAADIAEAVTFIVTGEKGPPKHIRADLGINQFVATGSQPLEPLTAVVMDDMENRIPNTDVTFSVVVGEALFENGSNTITVTTDKNGYAATRPVMGATPGMVIVKAAPATNTDTFFEATFTLQALQAKDGPTPFSGIVMNDKDQPLPGARMSIGRTSLSTTVDDQGQFVFDDIPPGKIDLFVDGRTVNITGQQYPALHFEATAVKGAANQLPHPIYLPQLQMAEAKIVGGDQDVILHMPGFEGYEMTVFANSVTFPDGSKTGPLVVSPISLDKLPMTPPGGYAGFMAPAATIQPSGTRFDPPVQLKIPNSAGFKPGEKKPVYQWDHDLATFVQMGQATVTEDGAFLITDPGTGISKAGWHPIPNPPPPDDCPSGGALVCNECLKVSSTGGKCPKLYCEADAGQSGQQCANDICKECKGGACVAKQVTVNITVSPTGDAEFLSDTTITATAALSPGGDPSKIQWEVTSLTDKATGIIEPNPANKMGASFSFKADNIPKLDASYQPNNPLKFEIKATYCASSATKIVEQDKKDIIRQEYVDFNGKPYGNGTFTLSKPDKSNINPLGRYVGISTANRPYPFGLGTPYETASAIALSFDALIKTESGKVFDASIAQAVADPQLLAQLQVTKAAMQARNFYPRLNSAYRSPRHNLKAGSTSRCSNHMAGAAVDLELVWIPSNMDTALTWQLLRNTGANIYGRAFCEATGDKSTVRSCPGDTLIIGGGTLVDTVSIVHADQGSVSCN